MQVCKKSNKKDLKNFAELQTTQKIVIPLFQQVTVPVRGEVLYGPTNSAVAAKPAFERRDGLPVSPALVFLTEGKRMLQNTNPHGHTYALDG